MSPPYVLLKRIMCSFSMPGWQKLCKGRSADSGWALYQSYFVAICCIIFEDDYSATYNWNEKIFSFLRCRVLCSCLWNNLLENMFMSWTGVLFGRGEAINLILQLKETNGILSIIPDFGRIYNLFAPKSIESKSWLNFSNMCFLRSKNMKAIPGLVLAVSPLGLELFTLPSH